MASVHNYNFYQTTRLGDDKTDLSQRTLQNSEFANYILDSFRPSCPMNTAIDFATSQPNVNFTGSRQLSVGGTNIAESSQLLINDISRTKCRISLLERPYLTIPYLGRGKCDPMLESQMQQGDFANNKKSISFSIQPRIHNAISLRDWMLIYANQRMDIEFYIKHIIFYYKNGIIL